MHMHLHVYVCMYTYLLPPAAPGVAPLVHSVVASLMPISFTVALERLHILQYMLHYDVKKA